MWINIWDVHKFICHCLIPLDSWLFFQKISNDFLFRETDIESKNLPENSDKKSATLVRYNICIRPIFNLVADKFKGKRRVLIIPNFNFTVFNMLIIFFYKTNFVSLFFYEHYPNRSIDIHTEMYLSPFSKEFFLSGSKLFSATCLCLYSWHCWMIFKDPFASWHKVLEMGTESYLTPSPSSVLL